MNTTGLRILLLVGALTATCAFVPHHHRAVAWSVRSPRATPPLVPRSSSFLAVLRQQQSTDGRNSTSFSYSDEDISKELFERQAMDQFQKLQQLEKLVGGGVQQQLDQDESFVTHTEDTSSLTTTTTTSEITTSTTENTFLSTIWRARLLLLGAAALYGTNFSIIKVLGDTMPVGISATLRFGLAALATLPWLLAPPKDGSSLWDSLNTENVVEKESSSSTSSAIAANPSTTTSTSSAISPPWHNNWWDSVKSLASTTTVGAALAGFEVGMWNSVGYLAQAVGLETTDASKSAFICSLAVVIVPILDFMSGKRLLSREIVGAVMAVAGVGFLEFGGGSDLTLSSGDIASLLQPLVFGVAFWKMETAMRQYPDEANRSTAAQLLAVFLASGAYCLSTCNVDLAQVQGWLMDPAILGALFFTGIITTALTVYMEAVALKTLTAAETTLILSTEPLWGAGFAAFLIGETFGMDAAMGAVLILAGCVFSNLGVDGVLALFGKKKLPAEEVEMEEVAIESDEVATRAIIDVGMIGLIARLIAFLEADMAITASTMLVGEEIAEEVIKHSDML